MSTRIKEEVKLTHIKEQHCDGPCHGEETLLEFIAYHLDGGYGGPHDCGPEGSMFATGYDFCSLMCLAQWVIQEQYKFPNTEFPFHAPTN